MKLSEKIKPLFKLFGICFWIRNSTEDFDHYYINQRSFGSLNAKFKFRSNGYICINNFIVPGLVLVIRKDKEISDRLASL